MLLDHLYEAEKALRELATAKQLNKDIEYQKKLAERAINNLHEARYECYQIGRAIKDFPYTDCRLVEKVEAASLAIFTEVEKPLIRAVCNEIEGKLRVRCVYRVSESDASYINDLASCLHRVIEDIEKHIGKKVQGTTKCYATEDADPALVEMCKAWDEFTRRNYEQKLYSRGDYEALFAHLGKEEGIFRVGSAAGHATRVNLKERKVKYFDDDREVNKAMKELFEKTGMSCRFTPEGVECKFEKLDPKETAGVLAAATSMDMRMQDPCGSPGYTRHILCNFARERARDLETWFWRRKYNLES